MDRALLVMAKRPTPGQTKTRLVPPFSAAEAAELYACFLRDSLDLAQGIPGATTMIAYSPPDARAYFQKTAPGVGLIPQQGTNLGQRLAHVLGQALAAGFDQVVAMNSDSPTLPASYLAKAYVDLEPDNTDVVLGPCDDGGYYLIGWKQDHPRLVRDIQMSTPHVLADTLAIAAQERLRVSLLPAWYDVDSPDDVERVRVDLSHMDSGARHTRRFFERFDAR